MCSENLVHTIPMEKSVVYSENLFSRLSTIDSQIMKILERMQFYGTLLYK